MKFLTVLVLSLMFVGCAKAELSAVSSPPPIVEDKECLTQEDLDLLNAQLVETQDELDVVNAEIENLEQDIAGLTIALGNAPNANARNSIQNNLNERTQSLVVANATKESLVDSILDLQSQLEVPICE